MIEGSPSRRKHRHKLIERFKRWSFFEYCLGARKTFEIRCKGSIMVWIKPSPWWNIWKVIKKNPTQPFSVLLNLQNKIKKQYHWSKTQTKIFTPMSMFCIFQTLYMLLNIFYAEKMHNMNRWNFICIHTKTFLVFSTSCSVSAENLHL